MVVPEVEEILLKYKKVEEKVETILNQKRSKAAMANNPPAGTVAPKLSGEQAKERNRHILKELEIVKGNLRSKSIFSPTELQWQKLCEQYQENPSLPIQTWHCHLPAFV